MNASAQDNQRDYFLLLDKVADLVQSVGSDGKFLYVNKAWCETLGYSQEEAKKLNFQEILKHDQLEHRQKIFLNLFQGKSFKNAETVFRMQSGLTIILKIWMD